MLSLLPIYSEFLRTPMTFEFKCAFCYWNIKIQHPLTGHCTAAKLFLANDLRFIERRLRRIIDTLELSTHDHSFLLFSIKSIEFLTLLKQC